MRTEIDLLFVDVAVVAVVADCLRLRLPISQLSRISKARRREDFRERGKASEMKNEIKDATEFLASIREKLTTNRQSLVCASPTSTRSTSPFSARDRNVHTNLSYRASFSKLFEKDEVVDILPPLAHSLPQATLTEDDTTA